MRGKSFVQITNTKPHENPSGVSRVVPSGQTDGQRHITKLLNAFRQLLATGPSINSYSNSVKHKRQLIAIQN
jgi:hypothetical protein